MHFGAICVMESKLGIDLSLVIVFGMNYTARIVDQKYPFHLM